ncbi:hypothetical protein SAMN05216529_10283 [Faecalicatena contorta]|uniref:Uncharacterized protein n=1 Tax=Faecalicatena contorta TaxID=39482 RepID=A0A316A1A3_9FIRM|nr:hypothetical protein A8805_10283 [Faecalicatena contorta]SUQ12868.1 hypothetical protein SAMN05216529_10283 [Faecalicatena contorta]
MEYISAPEAAKNGAFQKGAYKNFAKKTAYQASSVSVVYG